MSPFPGGDERVRTDDPLLAKQVLSQLSYTPMAPRPEAPRGPSKLYSELPIPGANSPRGPCPAALPILVLPRKEVIQPHLPIRLPCYDFTPVIGLAFGSSPLAVRILTSGAPNSHGVTGGVYKARERIHRGMLIRDY